MLGAAEEAHAGQVARLESDKAKLAEQRAGSLALLSLPEVLRRAMDEGHAELNQAHAAQVRALVEASESEAEQLRADKGAGESRTAEAMALQLQLGEARQEAALTEAELRRSMEMTRELEAINSK